MGWWSALYQKVCVGWYPPISHQVQGDNTSELDFRAVQRGDPEMEQKMNRVLRGCVERRKANPICSLHDQGAGGNGEGVQSRGRDQCLGGV